MKVRLKRGWSKAYPELTVGNVYRVFGIEADSFRIISDAGEPTLFNPRAFEFEDAKHPSDWVSQQGSEGELYAYPPELLDPPGFFEAFFDYDMRVRAKFHAYVHRLCHEESALLADPPNTFVHVHRSHVNVEEPSDLYSEIDRDRCEVRRVEVFLNGRFGYANAKGAFGNTKLEEHLPIALDEGGNKTELQREEITRLEFEAIWDKALGAEESEEA